MPAAFITHQSTKHNKKEKGVLFGFTLNHLITSAGLFVGLVIILLNDKGKKSMPDTVNKETDNSLLKGFNWVGVV
jgi:hypothetical protein